MTKEDTKIFSVRFYFVILLSHKL